MNKTINQQAEIAILILSPIILVFIVFIKWMVYLLYSDKFLPVNNMILFAASGMLFKALSWAIAFVFLAKSESKLYFWNEFFTNIYMLGFNIAGYYWYGLTGLGISFLLTYAVYVIQVYLISKRLFKFVIDKGLVYTLFVNLVLTTLCLLTSILIKNIFIKYSVGIIIILLSLLFNLFNIKKRLGLRFKFF